MIRLLGKPPEGDAELSGRNWFGWGASVWTVLVVVAGVVVAADARRERQKIARVRAEEACRRDLVIHAMRATPPMGAGETGTGVVAVVEVPGAPGEHGVEHRLRIRLTGFRPPRPASMPDNWERAALERLGRGEGVVAEVVHEEGREVLRFMREAVAQPGCVRCHESEPFRAGDLQGGVSARVPLDLEPSPYLRSGVAAQAGLFSCWLLGLLGLRRGWNEWQRRQSERASAERAIRESERRFRVLFEEGPLGMALLDEDGRLQDVNRALAEMLGRERGGLGGVSLVDLCHSDDVGRCRELLGRVGADPGSTGAAELRWMGPGGRTVWAILAIVFVSGAEGAPRLRVAMFRDVTVQKEDEVRLRQQAALIDITQDAICVLSLEGRVEFWNPAAERLYGWSRAEVMGRSADDLLFGRVSTELLKARAEVLEHGSWSGELEQAAHGGRVLHVQSRFSLVQDEHGRPRSVLIVSTDLTDRKRLEQQFLRAQRMECVGALASGVAHDLNNVFAPILMVAECLAGRSTSPMDAELLELLRSSADRGAGVVRQLLAFSRGQGMARSELRLDHLMKEMGRLANETFPKNIHFTMSAPPDLRLVVADPTQLHQVMLNLCVNARDAMPAGGELHLEARNLRVDEVFCQMNREARPGPYVVVEVSDTGEGIPESIRDRIFDPFFTTKQPGKGTGLGLSTVLNIVRAHGGFIEVISRVGDGTRFKVFLPAVDHANGMPAPAVTAPVLPRGSGECILVVDDEEAICRVARQLLEQCGYRPIGVTDAIEALAQFAERRGEIQAVITDMMMPDMDGASFIRAIRRVAGEVPIVAMSGSATELREVGFAAQRNISFLEKPFTAERLLGALHKALAGKGGSTGHDIAGGLGG